MSVIIPDQPLNDRPTQPARPEYRPSHPQEVFIVPLLKAKIEKLLDQFAMTLASLNRTALDIGCGRQPFRGRIEAAGFKYFGADVAQNPEESVDYVCAIDRDLPEELEKSAPFGLIICTEVMEHVADWHVAFSNLYRLTDVGGIVILTCPFFFPLHEEPYDFWRPTPHALRHFAGQAGFRVVECEKAGDAWDVIGTLMGCVLTYPPGPKLVSRIASVARRWTHSATLWALRKRIFQRLIPLRGYIYLSNIFVIQK